MQAALLATTPPRSPESSRDVVGQMVTSGQSKTSLAYNPKTANKAKNSTLLPNSLVLVLPKLDPPVNHGLAGIYHGPYAITLDRSEMAQPKVVSKKVKGFFSGKLEPLACHLHVPQSVEQGLILLNRDLRAAAVRKGARGYKRADGLQDGASTVEDLPGTGRRKPNCEKSYGAPCFFPQPRNKCRMQAGGELPEGYPAPPALEEARSVAMQSLPSLRRTSEQL